VIELYDEEPTFRNNVASIEPVRSIECFGDAGTLYHLFKEGLEVLNATRNW
jgi:hypothetical protein